MGSAPSKESYVIKPTIRPMSKVEEESSNNSSRYAASLPKSNASRSFLLEKDITTPVSLYGKVYKFSSSSGSLNEIANDHKQKIFLVTQRDDLDDHLGDSELILNTALPPITKRLTSKKYRVPTLRRIQEEDAAFISRYSPSPDYNSPFSSRTEPQDNFTKSHSISSQSPPSHSSVASVNSAETPFSLRAVLGKMGSVTSEPIRPPVKTLDSMYESTDSLIKFDVAPVIQSGRASLVSASASPSSPPHTPTIKTMRNNRPSFQSTQTHPEKELTGKISRKVTISEGSVAVKETLSVKRATSEPIESLSNTSYPF